ncbi:hypothetical protein Tco_0720727 [Tanacetum coccineum]
MVPRTVLTRNFTKKVNTVNGTRVNTARPKVNTARPKAVLSTVKGNKGNAVKASACWVWRPKHKVLDHVSRNNGASMGGTHNTEGVLKISRNAARWFPKSMTGSPKKVNQEKDAQDVNRRASQSSYKKYWTLRRQSYPNAKEAQIVRLNSWQCKKQTDWLLNPHAEAETVASFQVAMVTVLWIQNQLYSDHMFLATLQMKTIKLEALSYKPNGWDKKVIITETSVRRDLQLEMLNECANVY